MIIYILKFSACLALFLTFYKLVLEKENMHVFKRFYLLGTLLLSIGIPLITFTYYVEPSVEIIPQITQNIPLQNSVILLEPQIDYLPIILWSIYGLGVFLFGINFLRNLYQLNYKIKHNPKQKNNRITNVLLKDLVIPHTFFNYIFLNKRKFETHQIPKEVFWHEETHAIQKHSIDVLFIEILQIVFWFNPLIYFIKHVVKLNHEFLADQAVLKKGVKTATYQETLLAFSSNAMHPQLANAINYSSIKKRFTVMKTQTTKKAIWLRSLILLPLLAFTLYSFSDTKIVEKNIVSKTSITNHTARSIDIEVFNNGTYKIDDIKATKETFIYVINQLHQDITPEIRNQIINVHVNSGKTVSDEEVWFIYNSFIDYGFHRIVTYNQEIIREKGNKPFATTNTGKQEHSKDIIEQQKATKEQVTEYNTIIKKLNSQPEGKRIIKQKDVARIKYIYNLMDAEQKKNAKPFPKLASPPPPPMDTLYTYNKLVKRIQTNPNNRKANIVYLKNIYDNMSTSNKNKVYSPDKVIKNLEQKKVTKDQIAEYNKLAKKYNNMSKGNTVIKRSDLERIKYLYDLMSVEQRKKAQPFPSFPAPPPPPIPDTPEAPKANFPPPPPLPKNTKEAQEKTYKESQKKVYEQAYRDAKNVATASKLKTDIKGLKQKDKLKLEKIAVSTLVLEKLKSKKEAYEESLKTAKTSKQKAELERLIKINEDRSSVAEKTLKYRKEAWEDYQAILKTQEKNKALKNKAKNKEN